MTHFPDDVDVVIVSHNLQPTLSDTLGAVAATGCPLAQIIVVDVGSTDTTLAWLAQVWPGIRTVALVENRGPGPGRNAGILASGRPYVFLMDADVIVQADTVQLLRAAIHTHTSIAIGSPVVVHASRPDVIQYAGTGLHFICEAVNPWLDKPLRDRGTAPEDIGVASTCALLIDKTRALQYGLFDERYFIGKEDGDFTHRAKLAGYAIWEMPEAIVRHHSRARGTWLFYFQIRNRWHFMLKNYELRTLVALLPVLAVHETLQAAALVARGHGITYLRAAAGLVRMLPALPGDRAAVRRIRVRHDATLLRSGPIVVRDDLAGHPLLRGAIVAYEKLLTCYWRLVVSLVLPR
jgi:GT2 family glycosyltransferase